MGLLAVVPLAAIAAPARPTRPLIAQALVLTEWRKAENRRVCAPLAFAADGRAGGRARRANFSGGWAVAFDLPGRRSAYGVAGAGVLPGDEAPIGDQRKALAAQWPYVRALPGLKPLSFAGYGIEGAKPLTTADPEGRGEDLLAYVRVPGQRCLYNVWSRLGRRHLELLLDSLRPVPAGS
ncbi:MAG: hypothetical protein JWQ16_111 [Novosphingobium sp.]|nr:hypothetical protein [Novosphingobium sp.]